MAEGTDCVCCGKGVLLDCKRITFGRQKESFWKAKGVHWEGKRSPFGKLLFLHPKTTGFYGVRRNNRSGYGGGAIASYNDAIASYVIANLLRNTPSRATTTHAICCAT